MSGIANPPLNPNFTCPVHKVQWTHCPCPAEEFEARFREAQNGEQARSDHCPAGHRTAVRKCGNGYRCGLCGRTW